MYYKLVGEMPVKCSREEHMEWMGTLGNSCTKQIDYTSVDKIGVSTVFLGLDHSWGGYRPLLFETMIFGGEYDMYLERYTTYSEAVDGHQRACKLAHKA